MEMWKCENKEQIFFELSRTLKIEHRCVALLYALCNNDLNVQVSDTTKDEETTKS